MKEGGERGQTKSTLRETSSNRNNYWYRCSVIFWSEMQNSSLIVRKHRKTQVERHFTKQKQAVLLKIVRRSEKTKTEGHVPDGR